MRRILAVTTIAAALTFPLAGTAAADTGGEPNANANTYTGNGEPQGRKNSCTVPGYTIKAAAKLDGPNRIAGAPSNGQAVRLCTPAGS